MLIYSQFRLLELGNSYIVTAITLPWHLLLSMATLRIEKPQL